MSRLLIRGGHVVTMDPALGDVDGDVLVVDGRIAEIGPDLSAADAEILDATGTVVLPGFVDTHRHTYQSLVRGLLPSCTLGEFMGTIFNSVAPAYTPELMRLGNYVGALDALDAGITTMVDWSPSETPDHADGAIEGLRQAGIRAMYAHGMPAGGQWWYRSELNHPADARRIRAEHFPSDDGLLTMALALRQPGNVVDEVAVNDWNLSRDLGVRVSVHTAMRSGGATGHPIRSLHRLGLLGENTTFIHCTTSTDDEIAMIADSGGTVSIAPYVELVMGHGLPRITAMLAHGVAPTLSIDTVTTSPGDMFTQLRMALALGRAEALPENPEDPFTPTLTHRDVLRLATLDGARACGLGDRTGTLTPGKAADVLLVRADSIRTLPLRDPAATVVSSADRADVDTVLVAGVIRKRGGVLVGVDLPRLRAEAIAAHEDILTRAGLETGDRAAGA
ncbi:amidohydrolase family protein [Streptosporangium sp. NPDC050280]|uniref:amidohydrolase family protein n=1 Tax=unclassified Streptosporangium TaxID=2632669 RepID=UPI003418B774